VRLLDFPEILSLFAIQGRSGLQAVRQSYTAFARCPKRAKKIWRKDLPRGKTLFWWE